MSLNTFENTFNYFFLIFITYCDPLNKKLKFSSNCTVNEKGGSRRVETSHRWKFTTLRLLTRMWVEIYNHKVVLHVKLVTFTT